MRGRRYTPPHLICRCKHGLGWHKCLDPNSHRTNISGSNYCEEPRHYSCLYTPMYSKEYTCDCEFFANNNLEYRERKYEMSIAPKVNKVHPQHRHTLWCKIKSLFK